MNSLWKKLNLKDHKALMVLNSPTSFENELADLENIDVFKVSNPIDACQFFLCFVTSRKEIEHMASDVIVKTLDDAVVWFAYPKGTSKTYSCDFNRDNGWEPLFNIGFTGVRQVAIDDDWSALRFRRREFVKSR